MVAGCLLLLAAPVLAVMVSRGPYLQLSSPTNITICWRTDAPAASRVIYGTEPGALTLTNESSALKTDHVVTLTGLQPDSQYYYAVGTTETMLAGPGLDFFFLTHPWPGTEKPIRVWVIGDAGVSSYGGIFPRNQRAVRDAFYQFNGTNTVHAWLQLGDNAYRNGTDFEFQAGVFNVYQTLLRTSVTWPTLGNHDTASETDFVDTYPYFDIFHLPAAGEAGGVPSGTEHYYSFDLGMVHFVCLDSVTASRAPNGDMANWLRSDLAANSNRWTVAYWHHPPYTKGGYDSDARDELVQMRETFVPILEQGGVDLVMCGHSHAYERSFLVDGHYGIASTFDSNTMLVQGGDGYGTNGAGAYVKPDSLGKPALAHKGTVYLVAGCSGQVVTTGNLNHPIMVNSQRILGSVVLDFASNRLDVVFLPTNSVPADRFAIIKEVAAPPTNVEVTPPGATVNEGDGISFTATAAGTPPLTYQWQFDGDDLVGAVDHTLDLGNLDYAQAGEYSVIVSNAYGIASSNVTLRVNRVPTADAGATETLVISPNGTNAVVVLDGSRSSDPDGDAISHEWFVAGGAIPVATGAVAITTLPVGTNALTLKVNDGMAVDSHEFLVEVISASSAMLQLGELVWDEARKPQSLLASLYAAYVAVQRGQSVAAINQLKAFKYKVTAQLMRHDPELATQLLADAQSIINALSRGDQSETLAINSIQKRPNGNVVLAIRGQANCALVETSANLVDWRPVGVARPSGENAFEFEDKQSTATQSLYYRVRRP